MDSEFVSSLRRMGIVAVVSVATVAIAAPAGAQRGGVRELFAWHGRVDQEVRVQMNGGRASVMAMGPRERVGYNGARTMSGIPAASGYVTVQMREGRGNADVVEQPSARNGYTTVVRIRDRQSGAGTYDVVAYWQPNGRGAYGNGGVYRNESENGSYGRYDPYGTYGRYDPYPRTVIVERPVYREPVYQRPVYQRPVYRQPVYGDRGAVGGKSLPAPPRYPDRATPNGYHKGNVQDGKVLPSANRSSKSGKALPDADRSYPHGH